MTKTQTGYLLLAIGVAMITVLLYGDILTLHESHGQIDAAFVRGMLMHYGAVASAFAGGGLLQQFGARPDAVSDQKRAELSDKVGV